VEDEVHKAHGQQRPRRKIVRESRWLRVREVKPNVFQVESKLLQDGLEPDPDEIDRTWSQLSQRDRLDLCHAYHAKRRITKDDERILNIMMERGDEFTWSELAGVLTRHSDRARVSAFLRKRAGEQPTLVANYYQALETLSDKEAVPVLVKRYEEYRSGGGTPDLADRARCLDYLTCCRTLWKLTGTSRYRRAIEEHVNAPSKFLRDLAGRLLGQPS
jgi:hypothetical protein